MGCPVRHALIIVTVAAILMVFATPALKVTMDLPAH